MEILRSLNPEGFKKSHFDNNKPKDSSGDDEQEVEVKEDNGIINIIDFYPSPEKYHIVMELARG